MQDVVIIIAPIAAVFAACYLFRRLDAWWQKFLDSKGL